jgi:hypothetical protein
LHLGASREPRHDLCQILLTTYGLAIDANDDVSSALEMVAIGAQAGARCWGIGEYVQYFDSLYLALDKRLPANA